MTYISLIARCASDACSRRHRLSVASTSDESSGNYSGYPKYSSKRARSGTTLRCRLRGAPRRQYLTEERERYVRAIADVVDRGRRRSERRNRRLSWYDRDSREGRVDHERPRVPERPAVQCGVRMGSHFVATTCSSGPLLPRIFTSNPSSARSTTTSAGDHPYDSTDCR